MPRKKGQGKGPSQKNDRQPKIGKTKAVRSKREELETEVEPEKAHNPKSIQRVDKRYAVDRIYEPPSEEVCEFLKETLPMLSSDFKLDRMTVARELFDHGNPTWKEKLTLLKITAAFTYLNHAGILDHESQWNRIRGGYHFLLWRSAGRDKIEDILSRRPVFFNGKLIDKSDGHLISLNEEQGSTSEIESSAIVSALNLEEERLPKKRCCDNPHPVKSKKSGKRRCKNCGTKLRRK